MKYNKIIGYLLGAMVLFMMASCNPNQSNDGSLGPILPVSQIKLDVHATSTGGNQIVLINNTPHTAGMWVTGVGTSTKQNDTVLLPFLGKNEVYFYATTSGGIVKDSTSITISKIDHALSPTWSYLAGTGKKTWVWAADIPADFVPQATAGNCYGNGGYLASNVDQWWANGVSALQGWGVANDSMVFDLNGGANFTLYTGNNQTLSDGSPKGLPAGTYHGTFKFDMSKTLASSNAPGATGGANWSIGTLDLSGNVTVSLGYQPNFNAQPIYNYDILYLDDNVMILSAPEPGVTSAWGVAWFWIFKRKGYTFTKK
jgi:hypothetical protein